MLCAVGDMMLGDSSHFLGRGIGSHIERQGIEYPLSLVAERIRQTDLFIANLESPLSATRGTDSWSRVYRGRYESARALRLARRNIATIANNHIREHGPAVLQETRNALAEAGVTAIGFHPNGTRSGAVSHWEQNGLSISLYADSLIREFSGISIDIRESESWLLESLASDSADIRIVSLHWGDEYVTRPSAEQRQLGRKLVDAGATLVLGHHPHVLQPVEQIGRSLIAYSLGNFLFDQSWTDLTRGAGILEVELEAGGVHTWRFVPTILNRNGQPAATKGAPAERLRKIIGASADCGEPEYRALLSAGSRKHRIAMKGEILRNLHRVSRDTLHFLLTRKKRPRPVWGLRPENISGPQGND